MSYKLGNPPSPRPSLNELADFIEIECLRSSCCSFSVTEVAQQLGVVDDESTPEDEEFESLEQIRSALSLIEDRKRFSNNRYPFQSSVSSIECDPACSEYFKHLYVFLLLSTRENMKDNRLVKDIDGTVLFERLCAEVLKNFLGEHSASFVFGTGCADSNQFFDKLTLMLESFKEKGYAITKNPNNKHFKDAGIDVVAFIPFVDERHGHFVCFAQCKTGTSWEMHLTDLQPAILHDYINPIITPQPRKLFLISDDYQASDWRDKVNQLGGVLFDRCRIMSYVPNELPADLMNAIRVWNEGVLFRYPLYSH